MEQSPIILALVGRPNVGKSTLFNRITGKRHAIVDDRPGVTRDRRYGEGSIGPLDCTVIDTAGMEEGGHKDDMSSRMLEMTLEGIKESNICLLIIDGLAGVTPEDEHFARMLRKSGKPVLLVINKAESKRAVPSLSESYQLGFGEPVMISAEHGEGMADLYSMVSAKEAEFRAANPDNDKVSYDDIALTLAIIGRPNAGKSTLINALLGANRVLTGPEAGITRDSISVDWQWNDQHIKLVDTAGLRKQARRNEKLEKLSADDSFRAIQYAHVCVLLLDAACPLDKQDLKLAEHVIQEGRALVIAVNKWDEVDRPEAWMKALDKIVEKRLPAVRGVPIIAVSALKKTGFDALMDAVNEVYALWNIRIPTGQLNRWLEGMVFDHPPPLTKDKRPIRLKYITQIKSRPPTFNLYASRQQKLPESYRRYLVHGIRAAFNIPSVPIRLTLKGQANPYDEK